MTGRREPMRRRAPRLPIQIEGSLRGRAQRDVVVLDLSLTGCLVRCGTPLDQGTILDLDLHLDPDPFAAKVRVTGASLDGSSLAAEPPRYLTGLAFIGLPAREEARLRRFLQDERRRRSADASDQ